MKIIDISQPLTNGMVGWPGDTPYSFQLSWTKEESGSVNVGQLQLSTHIGTHIDAPFHFDENGRKVHELDLSLYVGKCRVVHFITNQPIEKEHMQAIHLTGIERLIIRTDYWTNRTYFPEGIPYLTPEAVSYLGEQGIRLIGLDLPSVDPVDSKELMTHHTMNSHGIHILEGLVLEDVSEGDYELIALPLPITDGDGSPVRAILRTLD